MAKNKTGMRGRFNPRHPEKYIGDTNKIFGRSSWEFKFFAWLDSTPSVLKWSSETIKIKYVSPIDGKVHTYSPDCLVVYRDSTGEIKKEIVEIKPYNETIERPNSTPQQRQDVAVNKAKWVAAAQFCKMNGLEFRVITEKTLMPKKIVRKKT
jgi:hypothetical protein